MDSYWSAVVWSLLPTLVVSLIFFVVLRSIIRADRTERRSYARIEAQERVRLGLPPRETARPGVAASATAGQAEAAPTGQ